MACRQHVRSSSSSVSSVNQQTDKLQGGRIRRFFLHTRLSVLSVLSVVRYLGRRVEVEDCRQSPRPLTGAYETSIESLSDTHYLLPPTFWKPFWTAFQAFRRYFHVPPGSAKIGIDRYLRLP